MKDRAKSILLPENPFEKIHGHTKIELTDIHTGKKKIIEHDNDFQSGVLAKFMRSLGALNNNPYANATWRSQPIWRNLCGGIFCFRDEIDNSENEIEYMPAGNQMVGNGAFGVVNNGTPTEMGSYNSRESQTSGNDSVTFVYDFTTSQANGTISCVCLTTEVGGYIGYGNPSGEAASSRRNFAQNQSSNGIVGGIYGNRRYVFSGLNRTDKTINVTAYPFEVTKGSIFDNVAEDTYTITYTGNDPSWNMSVGDPIPLGGGKFAVRFFGTEAWQVWNANATATPLMIIDLLNNTAETVTVTNTTGVQLTVGSFGNEAVDDECIYMAASNSPHPLYAINYKDGLSTARLITSGYGDIDQHPTVKGGILMPDRTYIYSRIWDKVADTILPTNGENLMWGKYNADTDTLCVTGFSGWSYSSTGYYKNPLILSTINNLDSPVTKTAAQTMKITYELTKASE